MLTNLAHTTVFMTQLSHAELLLLTCFYCSYSKESATF